MKYFVLSALLLPLLSQASEYDRRIAEREAYYERVRQERFEREQAEAGAYYTRALSEKIGKPVHQTGPANWATTDGEVVCQFERSWGGYIHCVDRSGASVTSVSTRQAYEDETPARKAPAKKPRRKR
jgi:hypothetical protein